MFNDTPTQKQDRLFGANKNHSAIIIFLRRTNTGHTYVKSFTQNNWHCVNCF